MKNPLLENENLATAIVKKITFIIGDIDERSVEKQLNELDEDTTREIIFRLINMVFDPFNSHIFEKLKIFLEDIFEHPMVHISDFYKQLSEKFNGKYSPEELEFICENEKQLICSLLKENDIVETKSNVYVKRYDKDCNAIGIVVSPSTDIGNVIERKNRKLQNFNSLKHNS